MPHIQHLASFHNKLDQIIVSRYPVVVHNVQSCSNKSGTTAVTSLSISLVHINLGQFLFWVLNVTSNKLINILLKKNIFWREYNSRVMWYIFY
jgi:hypothetical protein